MRRRRLGQHYLVDRTVVLRMVQEADIQPHEGVVEIGTGAGVLTKELVGFGRSFQGYEIDSVNHKKTIDSIRGRQGKVILGDAFAHDPDFDVLVSSLPYSQSRHFIEWLSGRTYNRAIVLLQKDFVEKIQAKPGTRDYRGISAIAQISSEVRTLAHVAPASFYPPPKVGSLLVHFTPKLRLSSAETRMIKRLFSLRRRRVTGVLASLGIDLVSPYGRRRVSTLTPDEVYDICRDQLS